MLANVDETISKHVSFVHEIRAKTEKMVYTMEPAKHDFGFYY